MAKLTESDRAILAEQARDAAEDAEDEYRWLEYGWQLGAVNHEAGCRCAACLDAIARFWQVEAERPPSLEAIGEGESW